MQSVQEQTQQAAPVGHVSPAWLGWSLAFFGLAVGMLCGSTVTRAFPAKDWIGVIIGGLLACCGLLSLVAGMQRVRKASLVAESEAAAVRNGDPEHVLPRLGEILVYKYHLITEKDVQKALLRQRASMNRPLGEILVEMGRITWRDLMRALEDQLSYGDPWKRT